MRIDSDVERRVSGRTRRVTTPLRLRASLASPRKTSSYAVVCAGPTTNATAPLLPDVWVATSWKELAPAGFARRTTAAPAKGCPAASRTPPTVSWPPGAIAAFTLRMDRLVWVGVAAAASPAPERPRPASAVTVAARRRNVDGTGAPRVRRDAVTSSARRKMKALQPRLALARARAPGSRVRGRLRRRVHALRRHAGLVDADVRISVADVRRQCRRRVRARRRRGPRLAE